MRVLHVSEAMGGGVISAVLALVDATPELEHHVLARPRAGHDTGDDWRRRFASAHAMPRNPMGAVRHLRRLVRELQPDVVHAHSSVGGVVARVAGLDPASTVYSPHCFGFERRDLSDRQRRLVWALERRLVPRTGLLVAVAPHEVALATELGHRQVTYVPNRALVTAERRARHSTPMRIVTSGRVCAQKDWRYLLETKRRAESELGLQAAWEWIGGGTPEGERALLAAGVRVTGWIGREQAVRHLADAQVYLHTAAWEGAPLAVLEAAEMGLPLAVRGIPSMRSLGVPGLAPSAGALATHLFALQDPEEWRRAQEQSDQLAHRHTRSVQAERLRAAYAAAYGNPAPMRETGVALARPAPPLTVAGSFEPVPGAAREVAR